MPTVDYYFSVLSPFTYLAGSRLEAIAASRGAAIRYRPLDIAALFEATGGLAVGARHPARKAYRLQELRRVAAHRGMPITLHPKHWPTDPRPASHALIAAQAAGFSIGLAAAAFLRAVWAEERDIADPATVSAVLAANGVAEAALAENLAAAPAVYAANTEDAIEAGVFGAPFYVVGDEKFWGQDRLEHLDTHLAALDR